MHRTSEPHVSDSHESHINLIGEFFHDPIQTMVAPLFPLVRRIGKQWSGEQETFGIDLFRSLVRPLPPIPQELPIFE